MFDIGFLEIVVVLVVALIVIGPERMPEVARKIGQFMGKTKRFINTMKEDSEITSAVRELQDSINLEEEKKQLESVSDELQDDFNKMQDDWGIEEEISRPTFGGEAPAEYTGSQFNQAPQQPVVPEESVETKPANKPKADNSKTKPTGSDEQTEVKTESATQPEKA